MLSGSAEPECRPGQPVMSPVVRGADQGPVRSVAIFTPADDAPRTGPTKFVARATIHPTVNGSAAAGCWAGSTAVN
jgi:hypothetical protein